MVHATGRPSRLSITTQARQQKLTGLAVTQRRSVAGERVIYDLILKQLDDEVSGMVKMTGSGDVDGTRGWLEDKRCEGAAALGLAAETKK